jgi:hypothetical protein
MLSWEKEAVPALIHGKKGDPFLDTPLTDSSRSRQERLIKLDVSVDGKVDARAEVRLLGHCAAEVRNELANLSRDEQQARIASQEKQADVMVNESSVSVTDERAGLAPVTIRYRFEAPNAGTRTERRILIRPASFAHRDKSFASLPRRHNSLYFPFPWSEVDRIEIAAPPGYSIEHLPEPVDVDIGVAQYRAAFTRAGDRVIFERTFSVNAIYLSPSQYQTFKAFCDRMHQSEHVVVSFRQD